MPDSHPITDYLLSDITFGEMQCPPIAVTQVLLNFFSEIEPASIHTLLYTRLMGLHGALQALKDNEVRAYLFSHKDNPEFYKICGDLKLGLYALNTAAKHYKLLKANTGAFGESHEQFTHTAEQIIDFQKKLKATLTTYIPELNYPYIGNDETRAKAVWARF